VRIALTTTQVHVSKMIESRGPLSPQLAASKSKNAYDNNRIAALSKKPIRKRPGAVVRFTALLWGILSLLFGSLSQAQTQAPAPTITMGITSVGPRVDSGNAGLILAQSASLTQTATLKSLSFYIGTVSGYFDLALYDASGANGSPGALLAVRGPFTAVSGWNTVTMSPVVLNPGSYWLAYEVSSNSMTFNVENSSGTLVWGNQAFGTFPSSSPTSINRQTGGWSFYATLVPTSAPTPTPTPTPNPTITMGITSVGPTVDSGNAGLILAQSASLTQKATLKSLSFYIGTVSGSCDLALYNANGANGSPGALLAVSGLFTPVSGWNTVTMSPVVLNPGSYWLAYEVSSNI